jgi:hypothetical protein
MNKSDSYLNVIVQEDADRHGMLHVDVVIAGTARPTSPTQNWLVEDKSVQQ